MYILSGLGKYAQKYSAALLICVFTGFAGSTSRAVEVAQEQNFHKLLEAIYSRSAGDVPYEILQERLWEYYCAPLALNQTSKEELQLLCILTDTQLAQLDRHMTQNGPLVSIYELQTIPEFDLATIQLLQPFVKVTTVTSTWPSASLWHQGLTSKDNYSLVRYERTLETRKGYQYNRKKHMVPYTGSPNKFFIRHSIKHPSGWEFGLAARKGAGEAFIWDPTTQRYGMTTWRAHWLLRDRKKMKILLVGDYAIGYGQGIVLNAGFSIDHSSETTQVTRANNMGIKPYTSVSTAAFRGVATTWQWSPLSFTMYYSNSYLDGKLKTKTSSNRQYVSRVSRGGYYRTQNEVAQKGQINEQVLGCTLIYTGLARGSELGVNALHSYYSLPIYPDTRRRNPLSFYGQYHANGSFFYRYLWKNFHCFGEGAWSKGGGKAAIAGVVVSLSRYTNATLLLRHYGQRFYSPYGKAFRANASSNSNERGIYLGAGVRPLHRLHLNAYYDYFYFPWCFGQPHAGHSWLAKATYQLTKTACMYLQYKTTTQPHWVPQIKKAAMGKKQNYQFHWQYQGNKTTSFKSKVQCNSYQQLGVSSWGYAAAQDIAYKVRKLQLKGYMAWFSAKSYSNKLYFYEPSMLYTGFRFRPYYGSGIRYCCLVCYRPTATLRLELRYAHTYHQDKKTIGSGYEAIQGNTQNEVIMQAIFRL